MGQSKTTQRDRLQSPESAHETREGRTASLRLKPGKSSNRVAQRWGAGQSEARLTQIMDHFLGSRPATFWSLGYTNSNTQHSLKCIQYVQAQRKAGNGRSLFRVTARPIMAPKTSSQLQIVYPGGTNPSRRIRTMIDYITEQMNCRAIHRTARTLGAFTSLFKNASH